MKTTTTRVMVGAVMSPNLQHEDNDDESEDRSGENTEKCHCR